jgi:DDE superfamily endonuclease
VDGLATRVQRPCGWANQKVPCDAKRHTHTAQGLAISTIHGDLLWCDGGWPGSCHEQELIANVSTKAGQLHGEGDSPQRPARIRRRASCRSLRRGRYRTGSLPQA